MLTCMQLLLEGEGIMQNKLIIIFSRKPVKEFKRSTRLFKEESKIVFKFL